MTREGAEALIVQGDAVFWYHRTGWWHWPPSTCASDQPA